MRGLLGSAAVAVIVAVAPGLHAQVTISTATTSEVATGTANGGKSAADVVISSTGSITLPSTMQAGTGAVTINSANTVDNEGTITINNANGTSATSPVVGILADGQGISSASGITIGGSIAVTDNPVGIHLPLTTGTFRYGIWVTGSSPFDGAIDQTAGSIVVRGNESAGILVDAAIVGTNSSSVANGITQASGAEIGITADNTYDTTTTVNFTPTGNYSYGILTRGAIQGAISLSGSITADGAGAIALSVQNNVGGDIYIDGTMSADGYYNGGVVLSRPVPYPNPKTLTAGNKLQSGPVVFIGTVAGGSNTSTTIAGGVEIDSSGTLVSYGSSPALEIAAAVNAPTTIDASSTTGVGVLINGVVKADGIYDGFTATGIQIGGNPIGGGTGGGTVTINSGSATGDAGVKVVGLVDVNAFAANATAISLQNGAQGVSLDVTGTIRAVVNYGYGGATSCTAVACMATGIQGFGGAVSSITNNGTIKATTVSGSAANAIDLWQTTGAVSVSQTQLTSTATTTYVTPTITGNVLFGNGTGTLQLNNGTIVGNVTFGGNLYTGTGNLTISNDSLLAGNLTYAGSGESYLTIDSGGRLTGGLFDINTGSLLNVTINNGTLTDTNTANVSLSSLTMGKGGQIVLAFDPADHQIGSFTVSGQTSFTQGAEIGLDFQSKLVGAENNLQIINAPSGLSASASSLLFGDVPYFYVAKFVASDTSVSLDIRDRTFAEAGVFGNAAAYQAIFNTYDRDPGIFNTYNTASTQQAFRNIYQQSLPFYSGGLFELLADASDAIARAQVSSPVAQRGDRSGGWAQQIGFGAEQTSGSTPDYHGGGLGFAFGWEEPASDISTIGYSASYVRGSIDTAGAGSGSEEVGTMYSAGVFWRETDGQFHANASANVGYAALNSLRNFNGVDFNGGTFTRAASSGWSGGTASAHVGIDYEQPLGEGYYVRPQLAGDYFMLYEDSHGEHNGGSALDLNYSSAFGKQGSATAAISFGKQLGEEFIWRPELTAGWKQVFGGPDNTTAEFASGGSSFTLTPTSQKGGALGRLGVHGGDEFTDIAFEAGGEDRGGYRAFNGQLVARFGF